VAEGVEETTESLVELDRTAAIEMAIGRAADDDIVLVLGRGHEPFQQIGDSKVPFDDRVVAKAALDRRRSTDSASDSGSMAP
jgi:UDP-N-acetylmuramoyl-L-alanyl-D-glutamate--2,6-diaminopimelate ligase